MSDLTLGWIFLKCDQTCEAALNRAGFDPATFQFETVVSEWLVPSPTFLFLSEFNAGVRTAALAAQSSETLEKISRHIATSVKEYAKGDSYAIPFAAHIISARKK